MGLTEINSRQIENGTILLEDLALEVKNRLLINPKSNVYAYASGSTTLISGNTKILFQAILQDSNSEFLNSTFTSKIKQNILVSGYVTISSVTANKNYYIQIYKNGSYYFKGTINRLSAGGLDIYLDFCQNIDVNIGDQISIYTYSAEAGKTSLIGQYNTFLKIYTLQ